MSDIRDWTKFIRGRWNWTLQGYEAGFPRGCQFTDVDAAVEFDGRRLVIEPKHHEGIGPMDYPPTGQLAYLRDEVRLGKAVLVLYGCAVCNSPWGVRMLGPAKPADRWEDWRDRGIEERRKQLKYEIDRALGLPLDDRPTITSHGEG